MKTILIKDILLNGEKKDILIEENRFSKIAPEISRENTDIFIDGRNKAILPPFYNGHTHAAMTLLRGYADDMPLFPWLTDHIWPFEARITPEDVYWGSKLAILEMIKSGTVFFADMYWDIEETIRAAGEMGIRAAIGVSMMDRIGEEKIRKNIQFLQEWNDSSGLIQLTVAPHAIYTVSESLLRECMEIADQKNIFMHIHLAETRKEVEDCLDIHGMTPVQWLDSLGILNSRVIAAHVVHVNDEEIRILKERNVAIVHNPVSNMKLSSGIFRAKEISESGCRVMLGTDGCSSNNNLDMRETMKFASLLAKVTYGPETLPVEEIFRWATCNGADAFGIDAGMIAEGKLADALLIDLTDERLIPNYNLLSNWVYSAGSNCIDTVICNGNLLMQNKHVGGEKEIITEVEKLCRKWHRK
jgi:5-methylthioadenosine/S-adenosylhomocysteine deaminase